MFTLFFRSVNSYRDYRDYSLHLLAVAYPGFQRGGCLRSGPIRKAEGGGGGGGVAVGFWPDTTGVGVKLRQYGQ